MIKKFLATNAGKSASSWALLNMPILKPLVGMDKTEIMEIARAIGTFETSILPFDDCCSVFAPKHPLISPKLDSIKRSESKLNIEELVEKAYSTLEIH